MTLECQEGVCIAREDQELDIYLSILMRVNAQGRSMHLAKDVDRASIQREAIKMIKGTKSISCEEGRRTGARVEGSTSTW